MPLLNHEGSVSLVPISGSKRHFYCCFLERFDDDWVPGEYATIVFRSATQGIRRGTKERKPGGLLFQKSRPRSCDPNRERLLRFSPRKFVASVPRYDQLQSRGESLSMRPANQGIPDSTKERELTWVDTILTAIFISLGVAGVVLLASPLLLADL